MNADDGTTPPEQVDQLLSSPSLVRAIENDKYEHLLDSVPVAVAVSRGSGKAQYIAYANAAFVRAEVEPLAWGHDCRLALTILVAECLSCDRSR